MVLDENARAHGDAELIRLLEGRAPEPFEQQSSFSIAGGIAWIGLAGWLFLGRREVR